MLSLKEAKSRGIKMQTAVTKLVHPNKLQASESVSFAVGKIVQISEVGKALVDYPGNQTGPIEARSVIDSQSNRHKHTKENIPVLLAFENGGSFLAYHCRFYS